MQLHSIEALCYFMTPVLAGVAAKASIGVSVGSHVLLWGALSGARHYKMKYDQLPEGGMKTVYKAGYKACLMFASLAATLELLSGGAGGGLAGLTLFTAINFGLMVGTQMTLSTPIGVAVVIAGIVTGTFLSACAIMGQAKRSYPELLKA